MTDQKLSLHYDHLIHTDARWFLSHSINGGYQFVVVGDQLDVIPGKAVDAEMIELIKRHKTEVMRLLTINDDAAINTLCDQCHKEINDYRIKYCE